MVIIVNSELLMIICRTLLVLVILFFLTKCMGKKQVSQMNAYDYLIGITIGSIGADIALDIKKDIIAGIVSLVILGMSGVLVTFLTLKSVCFRKIFTGVPTVLIDKGKILIKNLCKEGIDINDLQEEARQCGYFDLSKINYAVLETSGNISFMPKSIEKQVTRGDIKLKMKDERLALNIIVDGVLLEDNLFNINKDINWLNNELTKRGYKDYSSLFLCMIDSDGKFVIYDKNNNSYSVCINNVSRNYSLN